MLPPMVGRTAEAVPLGPSVQVTLPINMLQWSPQVLMQGHNKMAGFAVPQEAQQLQQHQHIQQVKSKNKSTDLFF